MHRLFIAIRPPEAICDLLVDAMDDSPELRWVGDELLHVTLRFVGEVERACQSIGLEPERRSFHPHITLARWNGRSNRAADSLVERLAGLSSDPFAVDRFILFESHLSRHGPHYEAVTDYELG